MTLTTKWFSFLVTLCYVVNLRGIKKTKANPLSLAVNMNMSYYSLFSSSVIFDILRPSITRSVSPCILNLMIWSLNRDFILCSVKLKKSAYLSGNAIVYTFAQIKLSARTFYLKMILFDNHTYFILFLFKHLTQLI